MSMLEQRIQQHFFDAADLEYQIAETLARPIGAAAQAVLGSLTSGCKLLLAGDGVSMATAQVMAALLVGRFERDRPGLAALVLGVDACVASALAGAALAGGGLAQQVQALGAPGDTLVVIAAGDGRGLAGAVEAARGKDITVVALTGRQSALATLLGETDVLVAVPHDRAARVHEVHLLAVHGLCDAVDSQLLGEPNPA
jgi:D-sedoheptulose 7-phosphate isomerase